MNVIDVSIVIVNYNAGRYLTNCLNCLQDQTLQKFEVFVVDNASSDNSLDGIENFPRTKIICNPHNRGFAAGQNQGITEARGRYVLSLNYDLVMQPNFLQELVSAMDACLEAGWGTGKLLNMTPHGLQLDTIYCTGHILPSDRFSFLRGQGQIDRGQYDRTEFVFGAPGAAAIYRRQMITDVQFRQKLFDEFLFTWYEDVDLDWRAQHSGWKCLYVPTAVAFHVGHIGENYQEPFRSWRAYYGIRNRWLTIAANETVSGFMRNFSGYLYYEFRSFFYVARVGLLGAYFRALSDLLRAIPYVLTKRKYIHKRRVRRVMGGKEGTR